MVPQVPVLGTWVLESTFLLSTLVAPVGLRSRLIGNRLGSHEVRNESLFV
jgi:hypothetical protein